MRIVAPIVDTIWTSLNELQQHRQILELFLRLIFLIVQSSFVYLFACLLVCIIIVCFNCTTSFTLPAKLVAASFPIHCEPSSSVTKDPVGILSPS